MSLPRQILPGATYLLTRRCLERRFFLRPSDQINQIVRFCLAYAAERSGVRLHAYIFLSNHYHLLVTDPHGNLPVFMHWLNEYIAKCVNAELGRWETFWAPGSYSSVRLVDGDDVLGGSLYVYTNPVESLLVPTLSQWPGAYSTPRELEGPARLVQRPEGFFRENGPVPATVQLRLQPPEHLEVSPLELEARVAEREQELRAEARAHGRSFLGRRRILAQSPFDRPRSPEQRRGLNPRVAARDQWRRIEALQRLASFLAEYRQAWLEYVGGDRTVCFPFGTYGMRVRFGVMCNGP